MSLTVAWWRSGKYHYFINTSSSQSRDSFLWNSEVWHHTQKAFWTGRSGAAIKYSVCPSGRQPHTKKLCKCKVSLYISFVPFLQASMWKTINTVKTVVLHPLKLFGSIIFQYSYVYSKLLKCFPCKRIFCLKAHNISCITNIYQLYIF